MGFLFYILNLPLLKYFPLKELTVVGRLSSVVGRLSSFLSDLIPSEDEADL